MRLCWRRAACIAIGCILPLVAVGQQDSTPIVAHGSKPAAPEIDSSKEVTIRKLPKNLFTDQLAIWSSPARVTTTDANWLVPLGIATGAMISTDRWVPRTLDLSKSTNDRFSQLSNVGIGGMIAFPAGMYVLGHLRQNEHQRMAGMLAGEAMVDSAIVGQVLKTVFQRERPGEGSMRNKFFAGGNGFPSDHALISWSSAAALTEAYPGWGSRLLFYGGATAVSLSRILANKHAPSDVLIGSTLGYLIGKKVYRRHTAEFEIAQQYGTFRRSATMDEEKAGSPPRASIFVPLDSWVYPAFDRLIALGYVKSGMLGLRPWTRTECERLLDEIPSELEDPVANPLIGALRGEFSNADDSDSSSVSAQLDSIYTRVQGVSGTPLTDDFFFGSTIVNDYGRPFQEGFSTVDGISGSAQVGPLGFYLRGEYQHAPGAPPLPQTALVAIGNGLQNGVDPNFPIPPALPRPQIDRLRLLDAYVAWGFSNWQLSFGKQSLWWGPGEMGPMMISDNAEPITMARLNRIEPFTLPSIFKLLGPIRVEMFIGRLTGHEWVNDASNGPIGSYTQPLSDQPYIMGQKLSLKPTPNLEIGVSRTGLFGGPGFPVTPGRLKNVFFSTSTSNSLTGDPGDRRTGFNFSYRIPGLRNWLMLYADSMAEDEINPIAYPRRSAMNPGIYLPQIPKLQHLDFRAEAAYTDLPGLIPSDYFYWNLRYLNGYTNASHLIGNWVGRQGKALQFSSRYWFSARNKIQVSYRKLSVNPDTGRRGTQQDLRASVDWAISPTLQAAGSVQQERWNFPVLASTSQSNTTVSLRLTYTPKWRFHR